MTKAKKKDIYIMFDLTPELLIEKIDEIVNTSNLNYFDATMFFCDKNDFDPESIGKIIPPSLKIRIEAAAIEMKLLKKEFRNSNRLPV